MLLLPAQAASGDGGPKALMLAPTHLAISWLIGHGLPERRDRRLVTWAGVIPDLDALSILGGPAAYSEYHHLLAHGVVAAVVVTVACAALARQRLKVLLFSLLAFHVHLICDLLGSGRDWAIVYFYPFSRHEYMTPYGWPLASPQNAVVWLVAVAITVWIGVTRGRTFAEAFLPARADAAIVKALREIFARAKPGPGQP
jgi:inner membrane protein